MNKSKLEVFKTNVKNKSLVNLKTIVGGNSNQPHSKKESRSISMITGDTTNR